MARSEAARLLIHQRSKRRRSGIDLVARLRQVARIVTGPSLPSRVSQPLTAAWAADRRGGAAPRSRRGAGPPESRSRSTAARRVSAKPKRRRREDHVAHRRLVAHLDPAALDVALRRGREQPRGRGAEAGEADPLRPQVVVVEGHALVERDDPPALHPHVEPFVVGVDGAVDQDAVLLRRAQQALEQAPVVEHVGIHVEHRLPARSTSRSVHSESSELVR